MVSASIVYLTIKQKSQRKRKKIVSGVKLKEDRFGSSSIDELRFHSLNMFEDHCFFRKKSSRSAKFQRNLSYGNRSGEQLSTSRV